MAQSEVPSRDLKLPKKLIVLCDGTWKNSDFGWEKDGIFDPGHIAVPTNVTRFARAIKQETKSRHPQIISYHAGVGSSSWSLTDHFLGGGLAYGISQNIREAYGFLAHNFIIADGAKDEIYLFGFSRGAFTARSVGGMISSIGLLEKEAMQYFYYIFEDYENAGKSNYHVKLTKAREDFQVKTDPKDFKNYLKEYKRELIKLGLSRDVPIQAIAVFDTVGSLGLPVHPIVQKIGLPSALHGYRFYDTGISDHVMHAFHALALDERRAAFNATVWEKEADNHTTVLKQVWFPGAHTDIGGGYDESSQADITMAWMIDQLSGMIEFNEDYLIEQFLANRRDKFVLKEDPKSQKPLWRWGLGTLHNSNTFPTSLGGSLTRTPGRYLKLDFETGKPSTSDPKPLEDSNEFIHSSVRARSQDNGKDAFGQPYGTPPALAGFEFKVHEKEDGTETATWTCKIEKDPAKDRVLQEAPMGELEKRLLGYDKPMESNLRMF